MGANCLGTLMSDMLSPGIMNSIAYTCLFNTHFINTAHLALGQVMGKSCRSPQVLFIMPMQACAPSSTAVCLYKRDFTEVPAFSCQEL